jgi:hypothetical protein
MKRSDREAVHKMTSKLLAVIDEYASDDGDVINTTKMAVALTAVTRVMAALLLTADVPEPLLHRALHVEMQNAIEAMASENETKH